MSAEKYYDKVYSNDIEFTFSKDNMITFAEGYAEEQSNAYINKVAYLKSLLHDSFHRGYTSDSFRKKVIKALEG